MRRDSALRGRAAWRWTCCMPRDSRQRPRGSTPVSGLVPRLARPQASRHDPRQLAHLPLAHDGEGQSFAGLQLRECVVDSMCLSAWHALDLEDDVAAEEKSPVANYRLDEPTAKPEPVRR